MNIIFCDMGSYTYRDIQAEFIRRGHKVKTLYYHFNDKYDDEFFCERINTEMAIAKYDFVFSVNFFPVISMCCAEKGIPYVSWNYDSPMEEEYEKYFSFNTNYIFLFDRAECEKYTRKGYSNVFHLPLAVNVDRLEAYKRNTDFSKTVDISFVGSLYRPCLDAVLAFSNSYTRGFIDGLIQTQLNLYGANIVEVSLKQSVIDNINDANLKNGNSNIINKTGLAYAINSAITHSERTFLLNELSTMYSVHYYGYDGELLNDSVRKFGPVKYFSDMNDVFLNSTLNLCPTLRSIQSGIPLRALDIVGCGATLFSNYQVELAEYFKEGVDVIMYTSIDEAFEKSEYYLNNEDLCNEIAINGQKCAKKYFNYADRINSILEAVKL